MEEKLLDASFVLIQALIRSPEQLFKIFYKMCYLESSFKRIVKTREFPDEGYLAEKVLKYKKKRSGWSTYQSY